MTSMQAQNTERDQRRLRVLQEIADSTREHTGNLARDLGFPKSTARRDLDWLEDQGFVAGILHDERDTLWNGRRRIYWSVTDRGQAVLDGQPALVPDGEA
jgi:DNA-binding MarR family transcriptional regulator